MGTGAGGLLASLAGWLIAALLLAIAIGLFRLAAALALFLRLPRRRGAVLIARLRGLRLTRSRAVARTEAARAAVATEEVRRLRAELRLAHAERDEALARLAIANGKGAGWLWRRAARTDDRFMRAKRAFAMRFHPDRQPRNAADRALRAALFREHWQELQRIERG